jgi:hypothetical protein
MFKEGYRGESILVTILFISYLLVFSARERTWYGGYCFGLRYLMPVMPFLIIGLVFIMKRINQYFVILVIIASITVNFLGLQWMEDGMVDRNTLVMSKSYLEKQHSFQVLLNPLKDHYWPLFKRYGPRSRLFESVWYEEALNIRDSVRPPRRYRPFSALLPVSILILVVSLINFERLKNYFKQR